MTDVMLKRVPDKIDPDDKLKKLMIEAMGESSHAKRRVEAAREEVARLERDLSAAQARLAVEQAEYDDSGKLMWEMFAYFKAEVERRWVAADASTGSEETDG